LTSGLTAVLPGASLALVRYRSGHCSPGTVSSPCCAGWKQAEEQRSCPGTDSISLIIRIPFAADGVVSLALHDICCALDGHYTWGEDRAD